MKNNKTKQKREKTGERKSDGACSHFFKRLVPVYQLLVYPVIGQIWQVISTLSKRVVPITSERWRSVSMRVKKENYRSAEEGTEELLCELGRGKDVLPCITWRFWLGALSNIGRGGQRNRKEMGWGEHLFSSWLCRLVVLPTKPWCYAG